MAQNTLTLIDLIDAYAAAVSPRADAFPRLTALRGRVLEVLEVTA